jgi:hypothetical protein
MLAMGSLEVLDKLLMLNSKTISLLRPEHPLILKTFKENSIKMEFNKTKK